ncbi:LytR/AlgR family response regulator transcription factor [Bacillus methanolicus]|uniref:Sensory transduction protein LytT n=1 Tax=Bacillus methanolicus (strain MGA3 / ATCC 53907) TaxID=796606 RepID=I3E2X8_BACMM|nr:LytTR family transcriptional regulator DNA-binding domain-containing protein [Bacillus methanolicus]AIE59056.1 Sensory transduction protein LytT [Bacillus methanolicus MGA3]EIJ80849.1 response regulator LytR [Bacillus methanolicus MGA3]
MLKVFIVDDEPLARDELAYLLRRTKEADIVGEADNVASALEQIKSIEADVIFLDIQLADESGMEIAQKLIELDHRPEIVFATAYDDYALKAFDLNAADYILKPFDEIRVQQTIEKLNKLFKKREGEQEFQNKAKVFNVDLTNKLAVNVDNKIVLINIKDILYLCSIEGKTVIKTNDKKYQVAEPLVTFERKLQNNPIIRVHRAYLVNLNAITEIEPWFHSTYNLIMQDGAKVPVSRTYTKELKELLGF